MYCIGILPYVMAAVEKVISETHILIVTGISTDS